MPRFNSKHKIIFTLTYIPTAVSVNDGNCPTHSDVTFSFNFDLK